MSASFTLSLAGCLVPHRAAAQTKAGYNQFQSHIFVTFHSERRRHQNILCENHTGIIMHRELVKPMQNVQVSHFQCSKYKESYKEHVSSLMSTAF